jgi:hypothetical protein
MEKFGVNCCWTFRLYSSTYGMEPPLVGTAKIEVPETNVGFAGL